MTDRTRRRRGAVAGAITLACVLAGAVLVVAARTSASAAGAQARIEQALGLPGAYTFTSPDPATVWELHRRGGDDDDGDEDEDRDEPRTTATGASVTFDLPVRDGEATSYQVRAAGRVQHVTVFPADTVTRLVGAAPHDVRSYVVVPSTLSRATHVLLVLHGQQRNAEEYCGSWVDWAAQADYVVVCPEFGDDDWPGSAGYNLGNVFAGYDGRGAVNPEGEWAFTAVEQLHRHVDAGFGLDESLFDLWGHSAGAQFVHRFLLFKPQSPVRYAIAANAGWYTAPDPATDIPYGLRHPELDLGATVTREHLVLMRGQLDTERGDDVRSEPEAEAQGRTRYHRAGFVHAAARAADPSTNWQLIDVPGAEHDHKAMAAAAQRFLLAPTPPLPHTCPLPDRDLCP